MLQFNVFDPRLQDELIRATEGDQMTMYRPEVTFIKPGTDIELSVRFGSLYIQQDFVSNYQDIIQLIVEVYPDQYRTLISNIQDLECMITLYRYDSRAMVDMYEIDPIILEYVVFVEDQKDVDKQVNSNIFGDNAEDGVFLKPSQAATIIPFKVHLMSKHMRDIRKVQFNYLARNATIEPQLHYGCQQMGVTNSIIVPPDNTGTIENFVVPPMKNISNFFPYLQARYGVYKKGLGYYYTNDTMYVYPLFDTDIATSPVKDTVLRIINGMKTQFEATYNSHNWIDGDLHIAATKYLNIAPIDTASAENKGDNIITFNADGVIDHLAQVKSDGTVPFIDNTTVIKRQNTAGKMTSNSQNVVYNDITSNIFQTTSRLAMDDGSKITCVWTNAEPLVLQPGQQIEYLYSKGDGDFSSMKGRLLGVNYQSVICGNNPNTSCIVFNAGLIGFLEAEKQSANSYQYS